MPTHPPPPPSPSKCRSHIILLLLTLILLLLTLTELAEFLTITISKKTNSMSLPSFKKTNSTFTDLSKKTNTAIEGVRNSDSDRFAEATVAPACHNDCQTALSYWRRSGDERRARIGNRSDGIDGEGQLCRGVDVEALAQGSTLLCRPAAPCDNATSSVHLFSAPIPTAGIVRHTLLHLRRVTIPFSSLARRTFPPPGERPDEGAEVFVPFAPRSWQLHGCEWDKDVAAVAASTTAANSRYPFVASALGALAPPAEAAQPAACTVSVDTPVFVAQRMEYVNLYHTLTEWLVMADAVDLLTAAGLQPLPSAQIVWADMRQPGSLDDAWPSLFGMPARHLHHVLADHGVNLTSAPGDATLCLANALVVPLGYSTRFYINSGRRENCYSSTTLERWRTRVYRALDIKVLQGGSEQTNSAPQLAVLAQPPHVLLIVRHDYVAHPRNPSGTIRRKFTRESDIIQAVTNAANVVRATVEVIDLANMTFASQVRAVSRARVLVGAHGAGLSHVVHLPPVPRVLVEVGAPPQKHFRNLATASGCTYVLTVGEATQSPDQGGKGVGPMSVSSEWIMPKSMDGFANDLALAMQVVSL